MQVMQPESVCCFCGKGVRAKGGPDRAQYHQHSGQVQCPESAAAQWLLAKVAKASKLDHTEQHGSSPKSLREWQAMGNAEGY